MSAWRRFARRRSALRKQAMVRSAPLKLALTRVASVKSAPLRSASVKSASVRSVPSKCTPLRLARLKSGCTWGCMRLHLFQTSLPCLRRSRWDWSAIGSPPVHHHCHYKVYRDYSARVILSTASKLNTSLISLLLTCLYNQEGTTIKVNGLPSHAG